MRNWPEDTQPASRAGEGGVGCKREHGCILSPSVWVGKTHQWGSEKMGGEGGRGQGLLSSCFLVLNPEA